MLLFFIFIPISQKPFHFFRGNLQRGLELFQKAVDAAHTETELAHLYSLLLAAKAQAKAAERFGLDLGSLV